MESKKEEKKSGEDTFEFSDFGSIPELHVPSLCEIWNWQGDTTILPHKVSDHNSILIT